MTSVIITFVTYSRHSYVSLSTRLFPDDSNLHARIIMEFDFFPFSVLIDISSVKTNTWYLPSFKHAPVIQMQKLYKTNGWGGVLLMLMHV